MTTDKNNKQRITLFLNPSITKQAKAQAIIEEITLTALVERALVEYLPLITAIKKPEIQGYFDEKTPTLKNGA